MSEERNLETRPLIPLEKILQEPSILTVEAKSKDCDFIDGNGWCEKLDLRVLLPYPFTLEEFKTYTGKLFTTLGAVPFDNRADYQDKATWVNTYIEEKLAEYLVTPVVSMSTKVTVDDKPSVNMSITVIPRPYPNKDINVKEMYI